MSDNSLVSYPFLKVFANSKFGAYSNGALEIKDPLKEVTQTFFDTCKETKKLLIVVNERKVKLQQIYKNLFLQLKKTNLVQVEYLDQLKPGAFSNPQCRTYIQVDSILVFLTKKHNKKELRLLNELKKTDIKVNLLMLGINFNQSSFNRVYLANICAMYWFLYTYNYFVDRCTYSEFAESFVFDTNKFDFKKPFQDLLANSSG